MLTEEHKTCMAKLLLHGSWTLESKQKSTWDYWRSYAYDGLRGREVFIRSDMVSFTSLDICVGLDLRIGGCMVDLRREA